MRVEGSALSVERFLLLPLRGGGSKTLRAAQRLAFGVERSQMGKPLDCFAKRAAPKERRRHEKNRSL